MGKIQIGQIVVGMIRTNCYLIYDEDRKETIIVDPGDNADVIERCIGAKGLKPIAVFLTHAHGDHIMAVPQIRNRYRIPVYVHKDDVKMLLDGRLNLMGVSVPPEDGDVQLSGGEQLSLGGMEIQVIHTPGHTPGGICYYFPEASMLISGDTMFWHSWGRTDFPGGSEKTIMDSIREKLLPLPAETTVYPGHECSTTIGDERKVHGWSKE